MTGAQNCSLNDLIRHLKNVINTLECKSIEDQKQKNASCNFVKKEPQIKMEKLTPSNFKNCGREMPEQRKNYSTMRTDYSMKPIMKIPQMRGSYLYSQCECVHRNGLQDLCPLSGCQGQPKCMVKPWPICEPGIYYRSKSPALFGLAP